MLEGSGKNTAIEVLNQAVVLLLQMVFCII